MGRQYIAVLTGGRPTDVFERIRQAVQSEDLTRIIPAVKFERGAKGQFYFFLGVEGQGIDFLDLVRTMFRERDIRGQILSELLAPDKIRSMVSQTELETHSLNALDYKSLWSQDNSDPFDLSDALRNPENTGDPSLGDQYDRLIHWLSASAEGSWQTFTKVCQVLQLADSSITTRSIFRRLILLGYIESSENGQKWSICPTALVRAATNPDVSFLTGQRTPKLIEHIAGHAEVDILPQSNYQGPSYVKVHSTSPTDILPDSFDVVQAGIASVELAELLPNLEGWKDILPDIGKLSTSSYDIEFWNGNQFTQCNEFYERHGRYFGESGVYRLTKREENNPYQIILYLDEPHQRWLRGDWYGLRFLSNDATQRNFEVRYDSNTHEMLIPFEERWPLLYERALVLASGMLPVVLPGNSRQIKYSGVSNGLVELLTDKLNVSIMEV